MNVLNIHKAKSLIPVEAVADCVMITMYLYGEK
jgi:hypothetical protein